MIHDITFGHGQISILTPSIEIVEFYDNTKTPLIYTDQSGRFLKEGIYLNKVVESQYPQYSKLKQLFLETGRKNNLNYVENYIHYVVKEVDCQHMYSLFFDLPYNDFLHFVVNNGHFLKETIENYYHQARDIILESKAIENRMILPNMNDLFTSSESVNKNVDYVCLLHKNTSLPIHLSPQRSQCLLYLVQGKTVKEIARAMNLSPKTIEHYLELLRKELGCKSSKELIIFYAEQLMHRGISPY
jgi:DNA-binding CsgD family transcriptional regulator